MVGAVREASLHNLNSKGGGGGGGGGGLNGGDFTVFDFRL